MAEQLKPVEPPEETRRPLYLYAEAGLAVECRVPAQTSAQET